MAERDEIDVREGAFVAAAEDRSVEEFFANRDESRELFESLMQMVRNEFGSDAVGVRVQKSQVTVEVDGAAAARVWVPAQYLGDRPTFAPLVFSVVLRRRDESPRWKEVVQVGPNRWTHHLEVRSPDQFDGEVLGWMREELAGR